MNAVIYVRSHGDDEDYIASVDSSVAVTSWFNRKFSPLTNLRKNEDTIEAPQIRGSPRHRLSEFCGSLF